MTGLVIIRDECNLYLLIGFRLLKVVSVKFGGVVEFCFIGADQFQEGVLSIIIRVIRA